jgi:hypothetical protein
MWANNRLPELVAARPGSWIHQTFADRRFPANAKQYKPRTSTTAEINHASRDHRSLLPRTRVSPRPAPIALGRPTQRYRGDDSGHSSNSN